MATRAFVLCGDEKAVQAVTQILDELEVSFEHSSEPPFALKRLAVQRFELLIVDCDNAQNATQVFNSARASNLNKNSIAIAIVEGKAGVPNAFRLGASLVLTKPVSLEQTRNTVRTGIGMTRKDDAKPAATAPANVAAPLPAPAAPVHVAPAPAVVAPVSAAPIPVAPVLSTPVAPAPVAKAPAVSAPVVSAPVAHVPATPAATTPSIPKPAVPVVPVVQKPITPAMASVPATPASENKPALSHIADAKPTVGVAAFAKAAAASSGAAPATSKFDSVFSTTEATGPTVKKDEPQSKSAGKISLSIDDDSDHDDSSSPLLKIVDPLADDDNALDPMKDHGVPSFGAIGAQPFAGFEKSHSSQGGGSKGWLIAAIVLLLLGAGGYAAWITQPAFRNFVAWEYTNANLKIAALRGQAPPVTAAAKPQPAPVPPASTAPGASQTADVNAMPNDAAASTSAPVTSGAATTSNAVPAQPANAVPESSAPKSALVQPAKQDTTAGRASANPALVPASASLPSTSAAKPAGDLLEVPEDYADDQVVRRVHPMYPKQAKVRKLQGTVVLQAIVNKQGKVDSLQLVSGDPLLAQAAADAVKQWRYKPYSHNGDPADFQTRVTVDFKLP